MPNIDQEIQQYVESLNLPNNIKTLISQAKYDLYYGPIVDDPEYPGFSTATSLISQALEDVNDLWIDTFAGSYSTSEPEPIEDDEGETIEPTYEDYLHLSRERVQQHIVGTELGKYL